MRHPVSTFLRVERRAAIGQRPMAFVPSKSARADLEPRHSAPSGGRARTWTVQWTVRAWRGAGPLAQRGLQGRSAYSTIGGQT